MYEGSEVKLDGYCTFEESPEKRKHLEYIWSLDNTKSNISDIQIEISNTRTLSFVAPFVKFNPVTSVERNDKVKNFPFIQLGFKLVVKDKNSDPALESTPSFVTVIVKMIQRVLIFQGGGALGAYELGAFKALCKKIMEKDNQNPNARANRPLFDIIAGTSIGAINAALIVHSVTEDIEKQREAQEQKIMEREDQCIIEDKYIINDTQRAWNYSISQLEKFWADISHSFLFFSKYNPVFWNWWKLWNNFSSCWINLYKEHFPANLKEIDLANNFLNPFYLFFILLQLLQ